MKKKYDWINDLDEKKIKNLMKYKRNDYKVNEKLKNNVLNLIRNHELNQQKKGSFKFFELFINKRFFKYSFSFAVFIGVLIISFIYLLPMMFNFHLNICEVIDVKGNVYRVKGNKKNIITLGEILKEKDEIVTDGNSSVNVKIYPNSFITINENTKIRFDKLYKKDNVKQTNIFLIAGEIKANPEKITDGSSFLVSTELLSASVRGTLFSVTANKNMNSSVDVIEGEVFVKILMDKSIISNIKPDDKKLKEKISTIMDKEISVKKGESLNAEYSKIKETEYKLKNIITEIDRIQMQNNPDTIEINTKIGEIIDLKNNIMKIEISDNSRDNSVINKDKKKLNDKKIEISDNSGDNSNINKDKKELNDKTIEQKKSYSNKFLGNLNLKFTEKNTAITFKGKNIYVASNSNKTVYSIDPEKGSIIWKFKDPGLVDITGPVSFFKDIIVVLSPDVIFFLNDRGEVISKQKITKGPGYWADTLTIDGRLYIPGSEKVYVYDGKKFSTLENLPESTGQLYISNLGNDLILSYSNDQDIKIYDLIENKIKWATEKIDQISFLTPLVINNMIYIADNGGSFYKFYIDMPSSSYIKLSLYIGATSNIIPAGYYMYFIANDGCLYSVDHSLTDRKIEKIDNNPVVNKYLTKKLIEYENVLYFCSDKGNLYAYDTMNDNGDFIIIGQNKNNIPLIGTPVIIGSNIYVIDSDSNIYSISLVN